MAAGLSEAAGDLVTYIYKEAVSPHLPPAGIRIPLTLQGSRKITPAIWPVMTI